MITCAPYVPAWFRRRLKRIDKRLTLRYFPPASPTQKGVPAHIYPNGVWDIANCLPSGKLHPVAVWSLADDQGNYAPPGVDTLNLIRQAMYLRKKNQMVKLEQAFEDVMEEARVAHAARSKEGLQEALEKFASLRFGRQWNNRVSMSRKDVSTTGV